MIEILHRYTKAVLYRSEDATTVREAAQAADLAGAYLAGADLADAYLAGADLADADLADARGVNKYRTTPLYLLHDQPGPIRLYKLVTAEGVGPFNGGLAYAVGASYAVTDADTNEKTQCGAGINLATLDWCLANYQPGYRILVAEFTAADLAAVPIGSEGKVRVHRCTIVGEKSREEVGLADPPRTEGGTSDGICICDMLPRSCRAHAAPATGEKA